VFPTEQVVLGGGQQDDRSWLKKWSLLEKSLEKALAL